MSFCYFDTDSRLFKLLRLTKRSTADKVMMRIESCPLSRKGREETLRKARSKLFQPQRGPGSKPAILISDPIPRGEPGILISAPISPYLCEAAILISPELGALVTRLCSSRASQLCCMVEPGGQGTSPHRDNNWLSHRAPSQWASGRRLSQHQSGRCAHVQSYASLDVQMQCAQVPLISDAFP